MEEQDTSASPEWLVDGGQTGELVRSTDWASTPLGPRNTWPQSLRTIVNIALSSSLPMVIHWGSELISIYNDHCLALAGDKHPHAMGRPHRETWPDLCSVHRPTLDRVMLQGEAARFEDQPFRVARHGDIEKAYFTIAYSPIYTEAGHVGGILVTLLETTQRVALERRLREEKQTLSSQMTATLQRSEERFRLCMEATNDGLWDWNIQTDAGYFSPAYYRILGYEPGEFEPTGAAWSKLIHPDDLQHARGANLACVEGYCEHFEVEYRMKAKDGGWRWILGRGRCVSRDEHGRATRVVGTHVDITQRKQAEEALARNRAVLNQAGQMAHLGAWYIEVTNPDDRDANPLHWSDEAYRIFGYEPGQVQVTIALFLQHVHPDDRANVEQSVTRAIADRGNYQVEHRIIRADGILRVVMEHADITYDPSGRPLRMVGAVQDITEQKQAQQSLATAQTAAEEANRAKDHFLAVLSHELRTPLTPVLPVLEDMAQHVPEAVREDLEMARRNVELEARLIDDLLDVTRISRGKTELHREAADLETIVRRAAEVCTPDIEARRLYFTIKADGGPYPVSADPARLQQVFWNLIKNAIKFTPHGGCVGVHCRRAGDGHALVEVQDSGIGIEPESLPRLFNAFEQVDRTVTRQFGGLGLGLAISKALVELHGGIIQAHSEGRGKGATFTVQLPIDKAVAETLRPQAKGPAVFPRASPSIRPLEILLVEDHGDTARIMRRMLQSKGHRVEIAGDAATALELARERSFDLIVSDLGLPDRSGLEMLQELHQIGRQIPSIALSGYGQEEDIRRSHEAGFREHLTKPVNLSQLEAAIGRVVAE